MPVCIPICARWTFSSIWKTSLVVKPCGWTQQTRLRSMNRLRTSRFYIKDIYLVMPNNTLDKATTRVGFIGLGLMGSRIARRLHGLGWNVTVWNRNSEPAQTLAKEGLRVASSIAELVTSCDVVLSCLAHDAAVDAVYFGGDGVFSAVT